MRTPMMAALLALSLTAPTVLSAPALAQYHDDRDDRGDRGDRGRHGDDRGDRNWQGDRDGGWDPAQHYQNGRYGERRLGRDDRIYRGGDGRYYCKRSNGTTGLVIGAIGGGLLGGAIGGNTLGALLGAGGGALLGQSVDRGKVRCR